MKNQTTTTTAAVSLLLFLSLVPMPTSMAASCVDSDYTGGVGGQTVTCAWTCERPSLIWVTADATDGDAGVSADANCGDGHAHCSGQGGCSSEAGRSSGGAGTCKATSQEAIDSGLHVTCSSDPEDVTPPVDEKICPLVLEPSPPYPEVCIQRPIYKDPVCPVVTAREECTSITIRQYDDCCALEVGLLGQLTCEGVDLTKAAVLDPVPPAAGMDGSGADSLYLCHVVEGIAKSTASTSAHIIATEGYAFGFVCGGTSCFQVLPRCLVEADGGFACAIR